MVLMLPVWAGIGVAQYTNEIQSFFLSYFEPEEKVNNSMNFNFTVKRIQPLMCSSVSQGHNYLQTCRL